MKAVFATGVLGAIAIALFTEIMNVVVTASAMQHVASYNSWMTL
ncbi:hypothetical protein [Methylocystis parvus]|nr:hypothetical protein [Methylocystis parvus]